MSKLLFSLSFFVILFSCQHEESSGYKSTPPEYIATDEFKKSNMPFSQAVKVGNILYLSGQVGEVNEKLVEGGIGPETKQAMDNIKEVLEQNSSSMDNVIKCTCMLADINEWAKMNEVYVKYFPKHKPARSALGASGLALGARVEIECMAYINQPN